MPTSKPLSTSLDVQPVGLGNAWGLIHALAGTLRTSVLRWNSWKLVVWRRERAARGGTGAWPLLAGTGRALNTNAGSSGAVAMLCRRNQCYLELQFLQDYCASAEEFLSWLSPKGPPRGITSQNTGRNDRCTLNQTSTAFTRA